ncbi:hypothetical protein [Nitratifractor sp.]
MKKIIFSLLLSVSLFAGDYLLQKGETPLFAFKTKSGKVVSLALGAHNGSLIYRFGKKGHVEFVYPSDPKNSFSKFTYSHYLRGGPMNAGVDLNFLRFVNKGYLYVLYDEFSAEDQSRSVGVKVIKEGKTLSDIQGIPASAKGTLLKMEDLIDEGVPIKKDEKEFD